MIRFTIWIASLKHIRGMFYNFQKPQNWFRKAQLKIVYKGAISQAQLISQGFLSLFFWLFLKSTKSKFIRMKSSYAICIYLTKTCLVLSIPKKIFLIKIIVVVSQQGVRKWKHISLLKIIENSWWHQNLAHSFMIRSYLILTQSRTRRRESSKEWLMN